MFDKRQSAGVGNKQDPGAPDTGPNPNLTSPPTITLPKGGGAIRGMGEKFAANPVTGTGSMSVPIATSPGRSGFGPQLSLSYNSGAGNGPFGLGWNLTLPSITRKTEKGLPKYRDADESDVFILSGVEDLVPVLVLNPAKQWVREAESTRKVNHETYDVRRYRPRIEGLFARIERWTNVKNYKDSFWRSISKDNITTWYGKTAESRVADPDDETKIFSWLICESHDDKGNVVVYGYKSENSQGIDHSQAHERDRTDDTRKANRYLKRIRYGNHVPYLPQLLEELPWPTPPGAAAKDGDTDWCFEVVFDYGEHYTEDDQGQPTSVLIDDAHRQWPARKDPFSSYRAGFEVRTYRICRRVLMFHHFPGELGTKDYLVGATHFEVSQGPTASFINAVTQSRYKLQENSTYLKKSLPPVEFKYSKARIDETIREVDDDSLENLPSGLDGSRYQLIDLDGEGLSGILIEQGGAWFYKRNLSSFPVAGRNGKAKVAARFGPLEQLPTMPSTAHLASGQKLLDLAGDGHLDVVEFDSAVPGFFKRSADDGWETFRSFSALPNIDWKDRNLKFIDLTGDGHADILVTEDEVFTWYPSLAEAGFGPPESVRHTLDEEMGSRLLFVDSTQSIYLSDFSGDGLTDLVRIRNGEVCYWPNLGYGRFGPKVTMDHAPWFDSPDRFDQERIRLADIDGSGVVDIIYLEANRVKLYFNQSGNRWSDARLLSRFPAIDNLSSVQVADLLGNGTACLVWSSPLPGDTRRPVRYIELMGGQKPHLLIGSVNNLGAETEVRYAPSTKFYLADKFTGQPWITKLPFPVHCVEKVTVMDKWRNTKFSTTYSYHHGYFDGVEREFRGFGRVEQVDTEDYGTFVDGNRLSPYITDDKTLYQPPVKTVTWFHTGAFLDQTRILSHYKEEYFPYWVAALESYESNGFRENYLPEPDLAQQDLTTDEWREALRACKGMVLRREVYELDVKALTTLHEQLPVRLFSAAYHNCHIRRLQAKGNNPHAVFLVTESEAIDYHYELDLKTEKVTPDPRVTHSLNLNIDDFGNVLQAVTVAYPRWGRHVDPTLAAATEDLIADIQTKPDPAYAEPVPHIKYTESVYTNTIVADDDYRSCLPWEMKTFELTGVKSKDISDATTLDTRDDVYLSIDELRRLRLSQEYPPPESIDSDGVVDVAEIPYQQVPLGTRPEMRLIKHVRTLYFNELLTDALEPRNINRVAIPYETYKLALTESLLTDIFQEKLDPANAEGASARSKLDDSTMSGYLNGAEATNKFGPQASGQYWMRSGIAGFNSDAPQHFYLPEKYTDPFSNITTLEYDGKYDLFLQASTNALGNRSGIFIPDPDTGAARFDYRVLAPAELEDINGNRTEVYFDVLGLVVAVAIKGKGVEADDLSGFTDELANPNLATVLSHFDVPSLPADDVRDLFSPMLRNATTRFLYHFGEKTENGKVVWADRPAGACAIAREQHVASLAPANSQSPLQIAFECSDGLGTVLMKGSQAEPEQVDSPMRWIVSGKTIFNNKGKPVKQYEPYFSSRANCCAEGDVHEEVGVTPLMYYDSVGRLVRTEIPDGTFSRVEFSPWHVKSFDANDTVRDSSWYRERLTAAERGVDPQTANVTEENKALIAPSEEKRAARQSSVHAETPSLAILDSLGRDVIEIAHNRIEDSTGPHELDGRHWRDEYYLTFTRLDAEGKPLWIRDARGHLVMQYTTPPKPTRAADEIDQTKIETMPANSVPCYDIAGNLLFQHSMDAGDRWMLRDAAAKPMLAWDYNQSQDEGDNFVDEQRLYLTEYDALHRPEKQWLSINNGPSVMIERFEYRDTTNNHQLAIDQAANLLGQLVRHYDQSGLTETVRRDFKGNVLQVKRRLNNRPTEPVIDWNTDPGNSLESEPFTQITEFDALNRITRHYNWHIETPGNSGNSERVAAYLPLYNERGALAEEQLLVRARKIPDGHEEVAGVTQTQRAIKQITYNARGQKTSLELGNGTTTRYAYDPHTFRLAHLFTRRNSGFTDDCDSGTANDERPLRPCGVQNLHYTYDAVGNITHIQDDAQQTIYFDNAVVEPSNDYVYDALYRLMSAKGRETAQGGDAAKDSREPVFAHGFPITDQTLRNYTETYQYDSVGNFVTCGHAVQGDSTNSWTREYRYAFDDLTKPASNRLWQTWTGGNRANATTYDHDPHGNMLNLARTDPRFNMRWDHRDMIRSIDLGGGGWEYYQYDSSKQRTRKYIERAGGKEERIYLGGYELYRRRVGGEVIEEIESHHLFEGEQRVLLVDDVIVASDVILHPRPDGLTVNAQTLFRYQYCNHLGSAGLELDDHAQIISYEEYHPYGTSAYRAMNNQREAPPKRYRYTGMERDEESGLNCHRARSYSPSLGRWIGVDPDGPREGPNLYQYAAANPVGRIDPNGTQSQPALTLDLGEPNNEWGGFVLRAITPEEQKKALEEFSARSQFYRERGKTPEQAAAEDKEFELSKKEDPFATGTLNFISGTVVWTGAVILSPVFLKSPEEMDQVKQFAESLRIQSLTAKGEERAKAVEMGLQIGSLALGVYGLGRGLISKLGLLAEAQSTTRVVPFLARTPAGLGEMPEITLTFRESELLSREILEAHPLIQELAEARRAGNFEEVWDVMRRFRLESGVQTEVMAPGSLGRNNPMSLTQHPGFLQIEEGVWQNPSRFARELQHELNTYYSSQYFRELGLGRSELLWTPRSEGPAGFGGFQNHVLDMITNQGAR